MLKIYINGLSGKMGTSLASLIKKNDEYCLLKNDLESADLVIDFSHPSSTLKIIQECVLNKKALIIGTTGLSTEISDLIEKASNKIPILLAANMSMGIYQLKKAITNFLKINNEKYSCLIEEIHHINKVDKPSGTAIEIRNLIEKLDLKKNITQIKVTSIREKEAFGHHKIIFKNDENQCCFIHEALSRNIFANGALYCAKIIYKLEPRIYKFEEMIN